MKYEISELLALRGDASIDADKFSAQAIDNDLLSQQKPKPLVLRERSTNRAHARAKTHLSRGPYQSTSNSERSFRPQRQPATPPDGTLAQTNAGFARFLKEHSSPKHQRVTAGGRIVPMKVGSPISEFKPSKVITSRSNSDKASAVDNNTKEELTACIGLGIQSTFQSNRSLNEEDLQVTGQNLDIAVVHNKQQEPRLQSRLPEPSSESNMDQLPTRNQSYQEYYSIPSAVPSYYVGGEMISSLTDSNTPFCVPPHAHLQTIQTSNPPLGTGPSTTFSGQQDGPRATRPNIALADAASMYPAVGVSGIASQGVQASFSEQTLLPTTYLQLCHNTEKSLQEVSSEFETLTVELTALDRYMAMNTFVLDPQIKQLLVEQRMGLVKDLDITRKYKEHLEANWKQQKGGIDLPGPLTLANWQPHLNQNLSVYGPSFPSVHQNPLTFQALGDGMPHMILTNPAFNTTTTELPFRNEVLGVAQQPSFPFSATLNSTSPVWGYGGFQPFVYPSFSPHEEMSQYYVTGQSASNLRPQVQTHPEERQPQSRSQACQIKEDAQSQTSHLWGSLERAGKQDKHISDVPNGPPDKSNDSGRRYCETYSEKQSKQGDVPRKTKERTSSHCLKISRAKRQRKKVSLPTVDTVKKVKVPAPGDRVLSDSDISSANSWSTLTRKVSRNRAAHPPGRKISTARGGRHRYGLGIKAPHNSIETRSPSDIDQVTPTPSKGKMSSAMSGLYQLHSRHSASGTPSRSQLSMFGPLAIRQERYNLSMKAAGKVCSPVLSKVTARGLAPTFDGNADIEETKGPSIKEDQSQKISESLANTSENPWYKRPPPVKPNRAEVEALFAQLKREAEEMLGGYGTMNR